MMISAEEMDLDSLAKDSPVASTNDMDARDAYRLEFLDKAATVEPIASLPFFSAFGSVNEWLQAITNPAFKDHPALPQVYAHLALSYLTPACDPEQRNRVFSFMYAAYRSPDTNISDDLKSGFKLAVKAVSKSSASMLKRLSRLVKDKDAPKPAITKEAPEPARPAGEARSFRVVRPAQPTN